jgi:hypothetical protein
MVNTDHRIEEDHDSYSEKENDDEAEAHDSKKARRSVTGEAAPPQAGLFIQNRGGQANDAASKHSECMIDKAFPSDAKPRLLNVIAYLVQKSNDKLHYVKLLFQHPQHHHHDQGGKKKNSPPPTTTWLVVRCLLQVNIILTLILTCQRADKSWCLSS